MPNDETLKVEARGDREIVMTRAFNAPRNLVYDAFTKPELLQRWLGVFGGWTFPVCEVDLRVGGRFRYVWRKQGAEMGMGGVYDQENATRYIRLGARFVLGASDHQLLLAGATARAAFLRGLE